MSSEEGLDTDPVGQSDPAKRGVFFEPTNWEKPPAAFGQVVGIHKLLFGSLSEGEKTCGHGSWAEATGANRFWLPHSWK